VCARAHRRRVRRRASKARGPRDRRSTAGTFSRATTLGDWLGVLFVTGAAAFTFLFARYLWIMVRKHPKDWPDHDL
jgi:hypothetical protein